MSYLIDSESGLVKVLFDLVVVHVCDSNRSPKPGELFVWAKLHLLADVSQENNLLLVCSPVDHCRRENNNEK